MKYNMYFIYQNLWCQVIQLKKTTWNFSRRKIILVLKMWSEKVNRRDAIETINLILEHTIQERQKDKERKVCGKTSFYGWQQWEWGSARDLLQHSVQSRNMDNSNKATFKLLKCRYINECEEYYVMREKSTNEEELHKLGLKNQHTSSIIDKVL